MFAEDANEATKKRQISQPNKKNNADKDVPAQQDRVKRIHMRAGQAALRRAQVDVWAGDSTVLGGSKLLNLSPPGA